MARKMSEEMRKKLFSPAISAKRTRSIRRFWRERRRQQEASARTTYPIVETGERRPAIALADGRPSVKVNLEGERLKFAREYNATMLLILTGKKPT
jgi:hypothetical protein